MRWLLFTLVLISTLTYQAHSEESSGELSGLSAKFQSLINELGENTDSTHDYRQGLTSVMQKLHRIQAPNTSNRTISLEWHGVLEGTYQVAPLRIVLVVSSFEGVFLNSGVGTFYSALTDFLVSRGHKVTVVYTNRDKSESGWKKFDKWKNYNEKRGVVVMKLDPSTVHVTSPSLTQRSYHIYQHLKQRQEEFDIVHFPDWEGAGYFSLLAKHQGLAFTSNLMVVGLHGPWRWVKFANQDPELTQEADLETDYLEQRSVELADALITPSRDLPQWLSEQQGWNLPAPENIFLMPFLPGKEIVTLNQRDRPLNVNPKVTELVFFGRLEERKGLKLFADALDILAQRIEPEFKMLKITFLGRNTDIDGKSAPDYIRERAATGEWGFNTHFISYKDRKHSLDYLMSENRLAVMPSLIDNAPYTVYECIYTHIPFIASNLPSISALVMNEDRDKVLFTPTASELAKMLTENVERGALLARPALPLSAASNSWGSFYSIMQAKHNAIANTPVPTPYTPYVTVCIPYYNRPHLLPMTIQSIKDQVYPQDKIEIVLVDDGSTNQDAIDYIDSLQGEFVQNGWQIIRTENRYLGAARNTAARAARGEYLLFLDDDNIAHPRQLATYAAVASMTSADIYTAAHDVFRGTGLPESTEKSTNIISRSVPLGGAVSVGFYKNIFGDANFYVKKDVFLSSGGFTEERGVGQEEHEWFAKAMLRGSKMEAIPESLLFYRMHDKQDQMMFTTDPVANQVRPARTYISLAGDDAETNDLLEALAHSRVRTLQRYTRDLVCNMTVTSVTPSSFYTFSATLLTVTAHTIDCEITHVYIGSFECEDVVVSSTGFTCETPPIPFPGTYSLSVAYAETTAVEDTAAQVTILQKSTNFNTAVMIARFYSDPSIYTQTSLFNLFAKLLGVTSDVFTVIQDIVTKRTSKRNGESSTDSFTDVHYMRFSITTPSNVSAAILGAELVVEARGNKDAFLQIGVTFTLIDMSGDCTILGCKCAPNYAGSDCSDKAACPNNCSANGDCLDGPFGRVCSCFVGHVGADCNFTGCLGDCNGHGDCVLKIGQNGLCQCALGWSGLGCNVASNCPNNCNGFGTCNQGLCVCVSGRTGADCSSYGSPSYQTSDNTGNNGNGVDYTVALAVVVSVVGALTITSVVLFFVLQHLRKP